MFDQDDEARPERRSNELRIATTDRSRGIISIPLARPAYSWLPGSSPTFRQALQRKNSRHLVRQRRNDRPAPIDKVGLAILGSGRRGIERLKGVSRAQDIQPPDTSSRPGRGGGRCAV